MNMELSRRKFLKLAGAAGAAGAALAPCAARASTAILGGRGRGLLIDTTRCVGCRACEAACSEKNALPEPALAGDDRVFDLRRTTAPHVYTVVNRYANPKDASAARYVKTQCMHCVEPACASACPATALEKTASGPVVYHQERCLGCRYCMVACPFGVPQFEYDKAAPYIRKCSFCADRQAAGQLPACADACPSGALQFGDRAALLEEARTRIYQDAEQYVHHVYGETEAGGTSVLYITDVPFERLGFRTNVGSTSYPAMTQTALSAVPFILTLWPPVLMGLYAINKRRDAVAREAAGESESHHE
jgi:Fe-S-cluster-containing dehydrogenase component